VEENKELWVALVEANDVVFGPFDGVGQEELAALGPLCRGFGKDGIAVGADSFFAELFDELGFEGGRDGVFEVFGLVVDLVPLHAENFGEHSLDEVMAKSGTSGGFAAFGSEADDAVNLDLDVAVALETFDGHGDSGSGDRKPMGEKRGNDGLAFAFGFEDRLEVIFFGNRD